MFADRQLKDVIKRFCNKPVNSFDFDVIPLWKSITTQMIINGVAPFHIVSWLEECIVKAGDKQWGEKGEYPKEIFREKKEKKPKKELSAFQKELMKKLPIIKIAKEIGLKVDSKGKSLCPFHNDTDPSLKFYKNTNSFFCFGCKKGGNVIKFIKLIKDEQNKN